MTLRGNVDEALNTIDDQFRTAHDTHKNLKDYLVYWRYITTKDVEVAEEGGRRRKN